MAKYKKLAIPVVFLLAVSTPALALTDEIQVYTGDVAPVGVFNLTWHNNYTPDGFVRRQRLWPRIEVVI